MFNPLVSIVLPVYNAEFFLKETIDSIINQSYKNIEIIIINDGSKDKSLDIIKQYDDCRILLIDQENMGLSRTLNKAILISKGDYICRIDADDICHLDRISRQIKCFEDDSNLVLVGSNVVYIDKNSLEIGYSYSTLSDRTLKNKLKLGNCIFHPSVMLSKSAVIKAGMYDENVNMFFEDYLLWLKLQKEGNFKVLSDYLVYYRVHDESISSNTPKEAFKYLHLYIKNGSLNSIQLNELNKLKEITNNVKDRRTMGFITKSYHVARSVSYLRTIFHL
ncbi:glycosyltransferase [Photobacterium profundum]|uniref:glycosyltransferase n=1 Tax=Photobacterium profundum TaxID=74109 RepID=UPI003D0FF5A7